MLVGDGDIGLWDRSPILGDWGRRLGRFVCGLGTHRTTAGAFFTVDSLFTLLVLAALVTPLLLQPYLVTKPEILQRTDFSDDFGYSLQVARVEDSRIQAARWIFAEVPSGQNIGVETGAFSVQGLIDSQRYGKHFIGSSRLFSTRGYLTCATGVDYLRGRLSDVHYVAITDVNRYRQYAAVAVLFPVLHDFYRKLVAGELGFAPSARWAV